MLEFFIIIAIFLVVRWFFIAIFVPTPHKNKKHSEDTDSFIDSDDVEDMFDDISDDD